MTQPFGTFLTGGTGTLGCELLSHLWSQDHSRRFHLLVRDPRPARRTLAAALGGAATQDSDRLELVVGDLEEEGLGLEPADRARLVASVDRVIHAGGSANPADAWHVCEAANVDGTRRMLELASEVASAPQGLARFDHVSCAFVAGATHGVFTETDLDRNQGFTTAWERSKYEAERLVRDSHLPWTVHRPSHLVAGGGVQLRALSVGSRALAPFLREGRTPRVDAVPVAWVARAMGALMSSEQAVRGCFHLTAGVGRELPVVPGLWSAYAAAVSGKPPLRAWSFQVARHTPVSALYQDRDHVAFDELRARRAYLDRERPRFDNRRTHEVLRRLGVGPAPWP